MLYDPKWDQSTKADPLSLDSLIAWLEQQPADGTYRYMLPDFCLLGLWAKSIDANATGGARIGDGDTFNYRVNGKIHNLRRYSGIAIFGGAPTFGAALERAKAMKVSHG